MRLLLFGLVVGLIYLFLRKLLRDFQSGRQTQGTAMEHMVRCAYCGVFLPEGEALTRGHDHFCCREHLKLTQRNRE
jgi:uncharacterized protein